MVQCHTQLQKTCEQAEKGDQLFSLDPPYTFISPTKQALLGWII